MGVTEAGSGIQVLTPEASNSVSVNRLGAISSVRVLSRGNSYLLEANVIGGSEYFVWFGILTLDYMNPRTTPAKSHGNP